MLHEVSSFCRAFKGYRVHCRDTQMFPVVPRHTLASNIKDPFRMERHKRLLWALKRLISLSFIFFETRCNIWTAPNRRCNRCMRCNEGVIRLVIRCKEEEIAVMVFVRKPWCQCTRQWCQCTRLLIINLWNGNMLLKASKIATCVKCTMTWWSSPHTSTGPAICPP